MGSNRKRPFGYKMELGEIVLHPAEAATVRWLYDSYLAGASYNALVDKLRERGISYDGDKPWNKNMAARILADRRYTGEGGFPSIIPEARFNMVQAQRQEKFSPCKKTPAQKELRKLCGGSPPAWVERQVLGLLNRLTQHPERITCPAPVAGSPPETENLRRELDSAGLGDVKIFIWDHNKDLIIERVKETFAVEGATEAIDGIAFHCYSGDHFEALAHVRKLYPDKEIIFT